MDGVCGGDSSPDMVCSNNEIHNLARRNVAAPCMLASAACLIPAATSHSASTAVICLTASLFFLEMVIGPAWAVPMDVGGEYSGTVTGIMNMAGGPAASLVPPIFCVFFLRASWRGAVLLTSAQLAWCGLL